MNPNVKISILSIIISMTLASCSNFWDKDVNYPIYYEAMVKVECCEDDIVFLTDNNIYLEAQDNATLNDSIKTGDRIWIYFTFGDSITNDRWNIGLKSYCPVTLDSLTTIPADQEDTLQTQPLYAMHHYWISNDYLNVIFYNFLPAVKESSFDLMWERSKDIDSIPEISLHLQHHANQISSYWYNTQMISFDLKPLKEAFSTADSIKVQFNYVILNDNSYRNPYTQTLYYETK